jgi:hypothetical protein
VILDKQGRLFGKVSVIDIALLILAAGLILGVGYRRLSSKAAEIISADTSFYVTFMVEKVRDFSVNAVQEGDVFYQQYGQKPLGSVVKVWTEQAREVLKRQDGTAAYVPMEEKFNMYITLACMGNINESGYLINGSVQVSEGSDVRIQSNKVLCGSKVSAITTN